MWKDLAYTVRTLRRSPLFTAVAVLSLALGIGANTAIFSLLDQVALRLLPVNDPERLVILHSDYQPDGHSSSDSNETVYSYPMYRDLRDHGTAFSDVIARMGSGVTLIRQGAAEQASAEAVSGNFFRALGVGASIGRVLTQADDAAPGANPVIVLSHNYWASHLGNTPAIINQTLLLNGHPVVVVGVAEARFPGIRPGSTADLFIPIAMQKAFQPTWDALEDRKFHWLNVFARLKPGTTLAKAQAATDVTYRGILSQELDRFGHNMKNDKERDQFLNHRAQLKPAAQGINSLGDRFGKPLQVMMAMVGLVLLIACANVANLMLARASGRQREIAIRLAIGASRGSLVKQLLLEGIVVALAGGALGVAVAHWTTAGLLGFLPKGFGGAWLTADLSLPLLAFTFALSVVSGLLFGLVPAIQGTRPDLAGTLKNQAANVLSGGPARFRQALVVSQVALSLLLVVGAGLFAGSLLNLTRVNLGFRTQHLLMFSVNASTSRPQTAPAVAFYRDLQARIAAIPGVVSVGAAADGPFSGGTSSGNLTVEGYHPRPDEYVGGSHIAVGPGFFRAMGIAMRAGREFTEHDESGPKKVVVNEAFAKKYLAGRNPIGVRMENGESTPPRMDMEIVGVVADSHVDVKKPPKETWYMPYAQWERPGRLQYYVRTAGDESRLAADIRQVLHSADPNIPMGNMKPMDVWVRETIYTDRLIAMLSGAFGILATLLAAIGLYGVIAYAVARRTSEIGVRMALGARPSTVMRMILMETGRMAAAGIALGLVGAYLLSRKVESELFGMQAADPRIFAAAAVFLAVVAIAAAAIPGWRASRIQPVMALKYE